MIWLSKAVMESVWLPFVNEMGRWGVVGVPVGGVHSVSSPLSGTALLD